VPKLLITQATGYRYRGSLEPYKLKKRKLVGAVIPYLAALAPQDWKITLVDDATEEIDFNADVDVAAITIRTVTSLRGYEIADKFRARGVTVIMGGPHATFYSDEVAEHADAVCIGEAEEIFPKMLEDAAGGRLKKFYRRDTPANLAGMPTPRWDLLDSSKYVFYRPYVIQYSRGCPFICNFCAERRLNGDYGYRYRPVAEVAEDIKKCGSKHIFFAASQFAGDVDHAMELMEALIPLKVRWSTLFSAHYCLDEKFMDLAQRSGLLHVNMGIESINQNTLNKMSKGFNKTAEYSHMIGNLTGRDISYSLNFVFGTDADDETVFDATLQLLRDLKAQTAYLIFWSLFAAHRFTSNSRRKAALSTRRTWRGGRDCHAISSRCVFLRTSWSGASRRSGMTSTRMDRRCGACRYLTSSRTSRAGTCTSCRERSSTTSTR